MGIVLTPQSCALLLGNRFKTAKVISMDPQNIEYDPWYCFSNTTSIDNFISQTNENYQTMFSGFDYQLKFLISRIQQLENEIQELKSKSNALH